MLFKHIKEKNINGNKISSQLDLLLMQKLFVRKNNYEKRSGPIFLEPIFWYLQRVSCKKCVCNVPVWNGFPPLLSYDKNPNVKPRQISNKLLKVTKVEVLTTVFFNDDKMKIPHFTESP